MKLYIRHTSDFPYFNLLATYRNRRLEDFYSVDTYGLVYYPTDMRYLALICKYKDDMR